MARKTIKLETGTIYQKEERGVYYYRYQINGERKAVSLKTRNQEEAIKAAKALLPVTRATTTEIIAAHVSQARKLEAPKKRLLLTSAWEKYSVHPDRATPRTVEEQLSYGATLDQFIQFLNRPNLTIREIDAEKAEAFSAHLKTTAISVDTHNRKIKRLRKIFAVLSEYRDEPNPFQAPTLRRREQEERDCNVRRLSFTREQEKQLLAVLDDEKHQVIHKPEIKALYHLGIFTGQRLKDCVLLRWNQIDFKQRRVWFKQYKTGKEVSVPMAAQLEEVLKQSLEWQRDEYVLPNSAARYQKTDARGKNVGNNLVNLDVMRVIRWIGLEPTAEVEGRKKKITVYGFHSLRHSFASHCAEAGIPKAVLLSILGTDSDIADKYYTHIGAEAQEKAIETLFGNGNRKSDRERIAEALAIIRTSKKPLRAILKQLEEILSQ